MIVELNNPYFASKDQCLALAIDYMIGERAKTIEKIKNIRQIKSDSNVCNIIFKALKYKCIKCCKYSAGIFVEYYKISTTKIDDEAREFFKL